MKNTFRLVAKDLSLQKVFLPALLLAEAAAIAILRVQLPKGLPGLTLILTSAFAAIGNFMICYRFAVAEEKDRAMLFIRSLPVSTWNIVAGKMFACLGCGTANVVALLGGYEALRHTALLSGKTSLTAEWFLLTIALQWVGIGFFLGIATVFDAEWAIWVPFPALFLLISAALNFKKIAEYLGLDDFLNYSSQADSLLFAAAVLLTGAQLIATWMLVRRKKMFV